MRPYKKIKIRAGGNRKTDQNVLDTVRGCVGARRDKGCYGSCYAAKMAHMSGVDFSVPVSMELDTAVLRRVLKKVQEPWIRIGVSGDPSLNWELTVSTCGIIADEGKVPVIITKAWKKAGDGQIRVLVHYGAILHVSVSALDGYKLAGQRLHFIRRYREAGGQAVARLITAPLVGPETLGPDWKLNIGPCAWIQKAAIETCREEGIPILETPLRLFRTNKYLQDGVIDESRLEDHISPFSGKKDGALTGGRMLRGYDIGYCDTACGDCYNQCWTRPYDPRAHVPREVIEVIACSSSS